MKGVLVGLAAMTGLAIAAPAFAFDAQTCVASYGNALPPGLTSATLAARCACVAEKSNSDPALAASLDSVFAKPLSERQAAMDANPDAMAIVEACRAQHP